MTGLIMVVERFPFLLTVGGQQGRIQVKQDVLESFDGIDPLAQDPLDIFQLQQAVLIHTVMEPGQS